MNVEQLNHLADEAVHNMYEYVEELIPPEYRYELENHVDTIKYAMGMSFGFMKALQIETQGFTRYHKFAIFMIITECLWLHEHMALGKDIERHDSIKDNKLLLQKVQAFQRILMSIVNDVSDANKRQIYEDYIDVDGVRTGMRNAIAMLQKVGTIPQGQFDIDELIELSKDTSKVVPGSAQEMILKAMMVESAKQGLAELFGRMGMEVKSIEQHECDEDCDHNHG